MGRGKSKDKKGQGEGQRQEKRGKKQVKRAQGVFFPTTLNIWLPSVHSDHIFPQATHTEWLCCFAYEFTFPQLITSVPSFHRFGKQQAGRKLSALESDPQYPRSPVSSTQTGSSGSPSCHHLSHHLPPEDL